MWFFECDFMLRLDYMGFLFCLGYMSKYIFNIFYEICFSRDVDIVFWEYREWGNLEEEVRFFRGSNVWVGFRRICLFYRYE